MKTSLAGLKALIKRSAGLLICANIFICAGLNAQERDQAERSRILFLLQSGKESTALELYQDYYKATGKHDAELLQQIALLLIEQGYRANSPEAQVLAVFGAGISTNERVLHILQDAISSPLPQLQLISLNFLSRFQSDEADATLNRAMASPFLVIRLEAALHMAAKKTPKAVGQIESLMHKVDPLLIPLFPQLYALAGTDDAIRTLRKLLNHPNEKVRVEAILSVAKSGRDDLLPVIQKLASHHSFSQQEACAYALGELRDESSISRLELLSNSPTSSVSLAALHALYKMGRKEVRQKIEEAAEAGDLYAIVLLGEMEGSEKSLFELAKTPNLQVRINAALSLLERKDPRCLPFLADLLVRDSRDLAFVESQSSGGALSCWKAVPSARQNFKDNEIVLELSLSLRERVLTQAAELPEKDFLKIAQLMLDLNQQELVPTVVNLLENLQSQDAIALLKKNQQKTGAPLIRNYCNLALFRMKEEGPYAETLSAWVLSKESTDLIQFRPMIPWDMRDHHASSYQLTPHDTSRLLVEAFEALSMRQDEDGINILLHAIQYGNPKNKYALAGLLMHAIR